MVKNIPAWIGKFLDVPGLETIEDAVRKAESNTTGEIVPILVRSSTLNASAPLLATFIAGFGILALKHGFWLYDLSGSVSSTVWSVLFGAAVLGGIAFGRSPFGQMLLTPRWEKKRQVEQRALLAFYQANLNQTTGRTGILLFISWRERRAVVLADEGIARHCQPEVFAEVAAEMVRGAREKDLAGGFAKAIAMSGAILSKFLPMQNGDVNELPDGLKIFD